MKETMIALHIIYRQLIGFIVKTKKKSISLTNLYHGCIFFTEFCSPEIHVSWLPLNITKRWELWEVLRVTVMEEQSLHLWGVAWWDQSLACSSLSFSHFLIFLSSTISPLSSSSCLVHEEKVTIWKFRSKTQEEILHAGTLISGFHPLEV